MHEIWDENNVRDCSEEAERNGHSKSAIISTDVIGGGQVTALNKCGCTEP